MKVIDLVHKRERLEEMPQTIKYNRNVYHYNGSNYFTEFVGGMRMTFDFSDLTREIEIIEENKGIEEIEIIKNADNFYIVKDNRQCQLNRHDTVIIDKINELVREVNKLKKDN